MKQGAKRMGAAALAACAAVAGSACDALLGIEDTTVAQGVYAVRGMALGVLAPVELRLAHDLGAEVLPITGDGAFVFETRLDPGVSYQISLVGQPPCELAGAAGTVDRVDPEIALTCDGVAALARLALSSPPATDLDFSPATLAYQVDVSLLQQATAVIADAISPDAIITVAGQQVQSGVPSGLLSLAPGRNDISIVVTHPAYEWSRTYAVAVNRVAQVRQYAYGKASNTGSDDFLGFSVAVSGDTLAVGAPQEDSGATGVNGNGDDDGAADSGAVYVFRRQGSAWVPEAYLKAFNTGAGDQFGFSVALSGDTLAVGAIGEDSNGNPNDNSLSNSGAVYVFQREGSTWRQVAYLKAANADAGDGFGISVALSGNTLAVGASREASATRGVGADDRDNTAPDSGAVYIFQREGDVWRQEVYIKARNTDAGDRFGFNVALSGDTLAVGAPLENGSGRGGDADPNSNGTVNSGAVYTFRREAAVWVEDAYIKASNTRAEDRFGFSVALSGNTLAVGAINEASAATGVGGSQDSTGAANSGAVYVFRRSADAWAQEAYIKASNTGAGDRFGIEVALSGDVLAVGAPGEDSAATRVDGDQADNSATNSGAVYVFRRSGSAWSQEAYVKASNTGADDEFGSSVALSEDTLAVGAPLEASAATGVGGDEADNRAFGSGAVYIFH